MSDQRPGVLFDLDGTLVDTNYLHTVAWCRALRELGEHPPMNAIHRLVGMGGDQLVTELLGHDVEGAGDARARQYQKLIGEAQAFPRAGELMGRLHDAGVAVVLASSAPEDELEVVKRALDADDAIDAVTSSDDVENSKPAPDIFTAALEAGNVDPRRAVAIGDSVWDIQAARAAGLGCIGVETGGFSQHELAEEGALFVYRDVAEIADQLLTGPLALLLG